ncbi:MAG: T9SS type A sorting domain-containing protein [Flavobacterium sp.]|uniref:RCC1 domain-containing protein n=1 Tax=Flavobacterium sp. TaxID=239 RepID=UPI0022BF78B3|nr:T9SS type A sorting domain-containing protein [Flavobacterium sp.]MCZ8197615.1 T9SS type A sorting domain-containing protein [Flavobacterium sp.]
MKKILQILCLIAITNNSFSQQCWKTLDADNFQVLGVSANGKLWGWGNNQYGVLGDGTTDSRLIPTQIGTASNWVTCATIRYDSFGIKSDGRLYAWGRNQFGIHGDGTTISKLTPTQIGTDTNWAKIAVSTEHCLAIKTNGTLWAWGDNIHGQLGDGTTTYRSTPVQIGTDTDWASITAGSLVSLAIKTNGTLYGWGSDAYGLNGQNNVNPAIIFNSPTQVGTDSNWKEVNTNYAHVVAVKTNGTLWSWGQNSYGELGNGSTNFNTIPTQIGLDSNWLTATTGRHTSGAIKTNGTLWTWGRNFYGNLGDGTTIDRLSPNQIGTVTNWKSINMSGTCSIATRTVANNLSSWGFNNDGQLGNNTQDNSLVPINIDCPTTLVLDTNEFKKNDFLVYPNPTNDFITIKSYSNDIIKQIKIIDILGKVIINKQNGLENIDVSDLKSSLFFIEIKADNEKTTLLKFIKQ